MPEITKALIDELIIELTALRNAMPEKQVVSTVSFRHLITTINNLNWALNPAYGRYPNRKR